jgi:alternate signal-mediated exported protein
MNHRTNPRLRCALARLVLARRVLARCALACCALAALGVLALVGGATAAKWSAGGLFTGAAVHAGDLQLTQGTPTWQQVTPGVSPGDAGGPIGDFQSMPGDVLLIRVPVQTFLRGDNLSAQLTVRYSAAITASFHIEDSAGYQVAPASGDVPTGTALSLPVTGDDAGVSTDWTVVLRAEVLGDYQWLTPQTAQPPDAWSPGTVLVTLSQLGGAR